MLSNHTARPDKVHLKATTATNHVPASLATVAAIAASRPDLPVVPFARFPHALAADKRLSPTERLIGSALLFWARDKPTATMSNRSLAKYVGVSLSVIERGLRSLARLGYIVCESVRATLGNATGRIVHLAWVADPSVLPAVPDRRDLEATAGEGTSLATGGPVLAGVGATSRETGGASSPETDKEDRLVKKPEISENAREDEAGRQRPERSPLSPTDQPAEPTSGVEIISTHGQPSEPTATIEMIPMVDHPRPGAAKGLGTGDTLDLTGPVDRAVLDARQLVAMTAPPPPTISVTETVAALDVGLTTGQRDALAAMSPEQLRAFEAKSPGMRDEILRPFVGGFDPRLFERITRSQLVMPRFIAEARPVDRSTPGLVAAVAEGDPRLVAELAEALCRDLGGAGDRRRWGALHSLAGQVLAREVSVEAVLDALRQAKGPAAEVPGAVFVHALRGHGWRPVGSGRHGASR